MAIIVDKDASNAKLNILATTTLNNNELYIITSGASRAAMNVIITGCLYLT